MKTEKEVYLDDLNDKSKAYKVKVKVIEKARAVKSPKKGTLYQTLFLKDEKDNRMRCVLFEDQVEEYKDKFVYDGDYEIENAVIKRADEQYRWRQTNLSYEMSFDWQTEIQPMGPPVLPDYRCISQIPKYADPDDKFDVLGVVLYVEEKPRMVVTSDNREVLAREIVIIDHSTAKPLIVRAWKDLAEAGCDSLSFRGGEFNIVGFTALKASYYNGFSLSTSMSTTFIRNVTGDKASALQEWAAHNQGDLSEMQARVLDVRNPLKERVFITLETLKQKKAHNTWQEERHWLKVVLPEPEFDNVRAYLGCSNCNKRTAVPVGEAYTCTTCSKEGCVSSPRVIFNCEVSDATGTLAITTYYKNSEKLFRMTAPDIFKIIHSDDREAFTAIQNLLRERNVLIEVGPNTALSINNTLKWDVMKIVFEDETVEAASSVATATSPSDSNVFCSLTRADTPIYLHV